jgi:hypothetical protein
MHGLADLTRPCSLKSSTCFAFSPAREPPPCAPAAASCSRCSKPPRQRTPANPRG